MQNVAGVRLGLADIASCMMGCWAWDTTSSSRVRKEKRAECNGGFHVLLRGRDQFVRKKRCPYSKLSSAENPLWGFEGRVMV